MAYDLTLGVLPDPNTNPAGPGWNAQSLSRVTPTSGDRLNGGSVIGIDQGGEYWTIKLSYTGGIPSEYAPLFSMLNSVTTLHTKFYVSLPFMNNPTLGTWAGSGAAHGLGLLSKTGARTVEVSDKTQLSGRFSIGDLVKLSNNSKLYMVQSVNEQSSTIAYTFNCDIVSVVDATVYFEPNDIKFKVVLAGNHPEYRINTSGLIEGFSLDLEETVDDE